MTFLNTDPTLTLQVRDYLSALPDHFLEAGSVIHDRPCDLSYLPKFKRKSDFKASRISERPPVKNQIAWWALCFLTTTQLLPCREKTAIDTTKK